VECGALYSCPFRCELLAPGSLKLLGASQTFAAVSASTVVAEFGCCTLVLRAGAMDLCVNPKPSKFGSLARWRLEDGAHQSWPDTGSASGLACVPVVWAMHCQGLTETCKHAKVDESPLVAEVGEAFFMAYSSRVDHSVVSDLPPQALA
jgi:hypothetical protein